MARLQPSGTAAYMCVTLQNLRLKLQDLKLKLLTPKVEKKVLFELWLAAGAWRANNHHLLDWERRTEPDPVVSVQAVAHLLSQIGKCLEDSVRVLALPEEGLPQINWLDNEARGYVLQALQADRQFTVLENPENEFLIDFCERARHVASACNGAAAEVRSIEVGPGPVRMDWFDHVTRAALLIQKRSNGKITLRKIARALEQLLPKGARTSEDGAFAKRLQRSQNHLGGNHSAKSTPPKRNRGRRMAE